MKYKEFTKLLCFHGEKTMIEILGTKYMTDKEASSRYGFSQSWFQKRRSQKKPPKSMKLQGKGRALYPMLETDQWFKNNIQTDDIV